MAGSWRYADGDASVEMSTDVAELVRDIAERAHPETVRELSSALDRMLVAARPQWPVGRRRKGKDESRPHSRDLLQTYMVLGPTTVDGYLDSPAPYTLVIAGNPWGELIGDPSEAVADDLVDRLGSLLAEVS